LSLTGHKINNLWGPQGPYKEINMEAILWILAVVFVLTVIFAADRQLWIKEIEKDLKEFLGDSMVARDAAEKSIKVHYQAQVAALRTLIKKHFKL
jgi:hypothetical protein